MTQALQWFRMYHRIIDDEKIRLLAFEDRWHFVAICSLKCSGLLDEPETDVKWRKVSLKMGVQARELDEIRRRLFEVGLVDELMHPTAWEDLQFRSDTSTERVRNFREKTKAKKTKRGRNVSVTRQETEADTESEEIANAISKNENVSNPTDGLVVVADDSEEFKALRKLRGSRPLIVGKNGTTTVQASELRDAMQRFGKAA